MKIRKGKAYFLALPFLIFMCWQELATLPTLNSHIIYATPDSQ